MVGGVNSSIGESRLSDDVGIGLLFVGMLALGVIIVSRSETFTTSLTAFLFGDILGVEPSDLALQAVIAVVVIYRHRWCSTAGSSPSPSTRRRRSCSTNGRGWRRR